MIGRSVFWELQSLSTITWFFLDYICDFLYIIDIIVRMHEGMLYATHWLFLINLKILAMSDAVFLVGFFCTREHQKAVIFFSFSENYRPWKIKLLGGLAGLLDQRAKRHISYYISSGQENLPRLQRLYFFGFKL